MRIRRLQSVKLPDTRSSLRCRRSLRKASKQKLFCFRERSLRRRRGAITLEMILVLPIFVVALIPIVQFGLLLSNKQFVEMASRTGSQVGSKLPMLTQTSSEPVPAEVLKSVATEMGKIGVSDYAVLLEHNIDTTQASSVGPVVILRSIVGAGPANAPSPSLVALTLNRPYVRVTVSVQASKLTPNLLSTFGFDLSNRVSEESALRRYAL